jgi:hypothetical protein
VRAAESGVVVDVPPRVRGVLKGVGDASLSRGRFVRATPCGDGCIGSSSISIARTSSGPRCSAHSAKPSRTLRAAAAAARARFICFLIAPPAVLGLDLLAILRISGAAHARVESSTPAPHGRDAVRCKLR